MPAASALLSVIPCANGQKENRRARFFRRMAAADRLRELDRWLPRRWTMAAASAPNPISTPASPGATQPAHAEPLTKPRWPWLKYATPLVVLLLAAAVVVTITRDWNAWEGSRVEQVTDDAIVRGDLTPLSTKVPGTARKSPASSEM